MSRLRTPWLPYEEFEAVLFPRAEQFRFLQLVEWGLISATRSPSTFGNVSGQDFAVGPTLGTACRSVAQRTEERVMRRAVNLPPIVMLVGAAGRDARGLSHLVPSK